MNFLNNIEPDVAEREKQSIKLYAEIYSAMRGDRIFQGIQYGRSQT